MRLMRSDEQAHLCEVQNTKSEHFISRCGRDRNVILALFKPKSLALSVRNQWHKTNRIIQEIRIRANVPIIG